MIKIQIINKIGEKIEEYQQKTGATKTWIAKQLGYKSKQSLDGAIASRNPTIQTLIIFSWFLNCNIEDLYEIEKINETK